MDKSREIASLIKDIVSIKPFVPIVGTVVSIESDSCTVKLSTGLTIPDIRLKSTIDNASDYFIIKPAVDSIIWLIPVNESIEDMIVFKIDKVQSFEIKQSGLVFMIDCNDGMFSVKNDKYDLLKAFTDLTDLISKLQVSTAQGPSGTPLPPTIQSLNTINSSIKNLLK